MELQLVNLGSCCQHQRSPLNPLNLEQKKKKLNHSIMVQIIIFG